MAAKTQKSLAESELQTNLLNEAQRKSLSIALKMVEERLLFYRLLLEHGSYSGTLFRLQVDFSEEEKADLSQLFQRTLRNIEAIKTRFDLQPVSESLNEQIMSGITYLWTVLEDERAEKLKRYGTVHPALKDELNPLLQTVISNLNEIIQRLNVVSTNFV